jgi:hypothetical protein
LRVVVRRRTTSLDTVANRRAVGLLDWLVKLCREVLASDPDQPTTVRCRLWLNRSQALQRQPLAQRLRPTAAVIAAPRQAEEATEARYRSSYEVGRGYVRATAPVPLSKTKAPGRAFEAATS